MRWGFAVCCARECPSGSSVPAPRTASPLRKCRRGQIAMSLPFMEHLIITLIASSQCDELLLLRWADCLQRTEAISLPSSFSEIRAEDNSYCDSRTMGG